MVILYRSPSTSTGVNWCQKFVLKGQDKPVSIVRSRNRFISDNPGLPFEMRVLVGDRELTFSEYQQEYRNHASS